MNDGPGTLPYLRRAVLIQALAETGNVEAARRRLGHSRKFFYDNFTADELNRFRDATAHNLFPGLKPVGRVTRNPSGPLEKLINEINLAKVNHNAAIIHGHPAEAKHIKRFIEDAEIRLDELLNVVLNKRPRA